MPLPAPDQLNEISRYKVQESVILKSSPDDAQPGVRAKEREGSGEVRTLNPGWEGLHQVLQSPCHLQGHQACQGGERGQTQAGRAVLQTSGPLSGASSVCWAERYPPVLYLYSSLQPLSCPIFSWCKLGSI